MSLNSLNALIDKDCWFVCSTIRVMAQKSVYSNWLKGPLLICLSFELCKFQRWRPPSMLLVLVLFPLPCFSESTAGLLMLSLVVITVIPSTLSVASATFSTFSTSRQGRASYFRFVDTRTNFHSFRSVWTTLTTFSLGDLHRVYESYNQINHLLDIYQYRRNLILFHTSEICISMRYLTITHRALFFYERLVHEA